MALNRHALELAAAGALVATAAVTVAGSAQLPTGWGDAGPQSGYFPYRLGWLLLGVGLMLAAQAWRRRQAQRQEVFATGEQLRRAASLFAPTALMVLAMPWLGAYLSSAIFLVLMARLQGRFAWWRALAVGLPFAVALFCVFELWFSVPLPRGPLEAWLFGY